MTVHRFLAFRGGDALCPQVLISQLEDAYVHAGYPRYHWSIRIFMGILHDVRSNAHIDSELLAQRFMGMPPYDYHSPRLVNSITISHLLRSVLDRTPGQFHPWTLTVASPSSSPWVSFLSFGSLCWTLVNHKIKEAVDLGRQLYVTNPDESRSALTESLANLSKVLEKLDRFQEAHDVDGRVAQSQRFAKSRGPLRVSSGTDL